MSRLGRGETFTVAEYLLKEAGVKVEMVKERFTDDISGYVGKSMTQFVDGMYVEQVRQWTKTKMEAMVKAGYVCGGTVPFGLMKEVVVNAAMVSRNDKEPPKRFVPHSDEAPIVRRAYELFSETASFADVQRYLNSVTSRKWTFNTITYLLRNETYRGILTFGEWRNEQAHEPIVTEELWQAVRVSDANRTRQPKGKPVDDFNYYLRGKVFCPHCGCRMTPVWHNGRSSTVRYYECINSFKGKTEGCPVRRINAVTLHESILKEIARAAQHPTHMTELIREAVKQLPKQERLPIDIATASQHLKGVDKQLANLTEAVASGGGSLPSILAKIASLESRRMDLVLKQKELDVQIEASRLKRPEVGEVCNRWSHFSKLWEEADEAEREELMQGMVRRVDVDQKEEGTCEIAVIPQVPSYGLELTSIMGAAARPEPVLSGDPDRQTAMSG